MRLLRLLGICFSFLVSTPVSAREYKDPFFDGSNGERNRQIFKEIDKAALYILSEYNADKRFRGFKDEVAEINQKLELLFLGVDLKSARESLRAETESLSRICNLNSVVDTLTLLARREKQSLLRKDLDAKLLMLSQPCRKGSSL